MSKTYKPKVVKRPIREKLIRPIVDFAQSEAKSGLLLISCAVIALLWANSPWAGSYEALWHAKFGFQAGNQQFVKPLHFWINDAVMAVFFLLVGLEIKRELIIGELASVRKAALPVMAALGGMVVPALIYFALNRTGAGSRGWGVPMATDIAFALGVLSLCGNRIPLALKVFLAAVAIVDDIGAVLVIAIFYTGEIQVQFLLAAGCVLFLLIMLNAIGSHSPLLFILIGAVLWWFVLLSGVHATIAGVLLAFTIPTKIFIDPRQFAQETREALREFEGEGKEIGGTFMNESRQSAVRAIEKACERIQMPVERIEDVLHPWVRLLIMPAFALANAGVVIDSHFGAALTDSVSLGIAMGLVIGKPIGITLFCYLAVRSGLASLPEGINWRHIVGVGLVAGIGFTMSLFVAGLAFGESEHLRIAKLAILSASVVAGCLGFVFFRSPLVGARREPRTGFQPQ